MPRIYSGRRHVSKRVGRVTRIAAAALSGLCYARWANPDENARLRRSRGPLRGTPARGVRSRRRDAASVRLLDDRDALIVADAALLLKAGDGLAAALSACPAAVVVVGRPKTSPRLSPRSRRFPPFSWRPSRISLSSAPRASPARPRGASTAVSTLEGPARAPQHRTLRAQQDRGGALGRARHQPPAHPHPRQVAPDHVGRRGQPLPRGEGRCRDSPTPSSSPWPRTTRSSFEFQESRMPLDQTSIAGYVAVHGTPVNVADAYELPAGTPYRISRSFDTKSGLPDEVDAGGAHARPPGRDHRRHPAHQQEDRRDGDAAAEFARRSATSSPSTTSTSIS